MAQEQTPDRGAARPSEKPEERAPAPVVERVTHLDIPAICALYKKVWDADQTGLSPEVAKTWEPTPLEFSSWMEGVTYFAARKDGRIVGVMGVEIHDGAAHLVRLAVDPEVRRQGVAKALTLATVDWARHNNSASVWADALARFTAVSALFLAMGFQESGVLHRHMHREDVRFFEKVL